MAFRAVQIDSITKEENKLNIVQQSLFKLINYPRGYNFFFSKERKKRTNWLEASDDMVFRKIRFFFSIDTKWTYAETISK